LAGTGTGVYSSIQEACGQAVRTVERQDNDAECGRVYRQLYEIYRELYQCLSGQYKKLDETLKDISG